MVTALDTFKQVSLTGIAGALQTMAFFRSAVGQELIDAIINDPLDIDFANLTARQADEFLTLLKLARNIVDVYRLDPGTSAFLPADIYTAYSHILAQLAPNVRFFEQIADGVLIDREDAVNQAIQNQRTRRNNLRLAVKYL
jgi:hypothetical protein